MCIRDRPQVWEENKLDGYIFVCPDEATIKIAEKLYTEGAAVNLVLRKNQTVPTISADTQETVSKIVDYFATQGKRDILFITGTDNQEGRTRLQGYLDGLARNNIPFNEELIIDFGKFMSVDNDFKAKTVKQFFERKIPFSATILGGRWAILSVLNAASDFGYRIPEDFAAFTLSLIHI